MIKFRVASDFGPRKDRNIQNVNVHGIVSFCFRGCVNFPEEYNIVARLTGILCDLLATEADLQNHTVDSKKMASCIDRPTCFYAQEIKNCRKEQQ